MFSADCSNIHSNNKDGHIYKANVYNGLNDLLQINFSQKPIGRFKIFERLLECYKDDPSDKVFSKRTNFIEHSAKQTINSFLENVNNLAHSESPLRAEFRIPINRVIPMTNILTLFFNDIFVQKHTIVLGAKTIIKLIRFWTMFLIQPIFNTLSKLVVFSGDKNFKDESKFNSYITNISAFESILLETFMNGTTKTSVSEILWRKSKPDNGENCSFNLMKGINELNRLNFQGTSWANVEMEICGTSKLLEKIEKSGKIRGFNHLTSTFKLIQNLNGTSDYNEKARQLWESYFNFIYNKKPDDFDKNVDDKSKMKLKHLKMGLRKRTFFDHKQAVDHIFNLDRLLAAKQARSNIWNVPYLIAYDHSARNPAEKQILDHSLREYAEKIGIEYVHTCGDLTHFFTNGTERVYTRVIKPEKVTNLSKSFNVKRHFSIIEDEETDKPDIIIEGDERMNEIISDKVNLTLKERINLCIGLNTFPNDCKKFMKISLCEELGFSENGKTNSQLRGSMRALKKNGSLLLDPSSNFYYLKGHCVDKFRPITPTPSSWPKRNVPKIGVKSWDECEPSFSDIAPVSEHDERTMAALEDTEDVGQNINSNDNGDLVVIEKENHVEECIPSTMHPIVENDKTSGALTGNVFMDDDGGFYGDENPQNDIESYSIELGNSRIEMISSSNTVEDLLLKTMNSAVSIPLIMEGSNETVLAQIETISNSPEILTPLSLPLASDKLTIPSFNNDFKTGWLKIKE